jgi:hypothetical protein
VGDEAELRDDWEHPHARRLSPGHAHYDVIVERHAEALSKGLPNYADPLSGFRVFTAGFLARRGDCCDSGCRHCPFVSES